MAMADDNWKAEGMPAIDTLNANSYKSAKHYLSKSAADVVLLQETKALPR